MLTFTRLGVLPLIGVDTFCRDLVPVERGDEIDSPARHDDDFLQQVQQQSHCGLHDRFRRWQGMSPSAGIGHVPDIPICGINCLDLPDSLHRTAEPQHMTTARLYSGPPLKAVTPRIMPKRRVTDWIWHSVLNMHVLMNR